MDVLNIVCKDLSGEECSTMLVATILISVVAIIFVIMCLCRVSSRADQYAENLYQETYRGDNNGNN